MSFNFMAESLSAKPALIGLYLRNFIANFSGNIIIVILNYFTPLAIFEEWRATLTAGFWIAISFALLSVILFVTLLQYLAQRPISSMVKVILLGEKPEGMLKDKAGRRLLNLPFFTAFINVSVWIIFTALFMPVMYSLIDMTVASFFYGFFRLIMIGIIASFISFFLIDDFCRKNLVPIFFPEGRLATVQGAAKISILRRIRVLFGIGTNALMILLVGTLGFAVWEIKDTTVSAGQFGKEILVFTIVLCLIFIIISMCLNFMVGRSILKPIKDMMGVVKKVQLGDFHQKVQVVSNDELGILGDGMNEMTEGLIERERMRESLTLAKEVQQALLPPAPPQIKGLDIAARIIYCDETGGDYYDFFGEHETNQLKISVVIGDVSGHGVPSALLMASARAFFRQRCALPGSISSIVSDVNRQLVIDVQESGVFMTLFYLTVDLQNKCLVWVRAGHDPAILYDPASDTFEELRGSGVALGIDAGHHYEDHKKQVLAKGQIIVLGTDGIWEAENSSGERFGKDPIFRIIRKYSDEDANGLLTACLFSLDKFRDGVPPEDDVTLIVIKIADL
jgi:sigma-B regulation protein RsbU (phosphoserine phosphatase)